MSEGKKISLDENGDIKINDDFLNSIVGGSGNPEDEDEEIIIVVRNGNCPCDRT